MAYADGRALRAATPDGMPLLVGSAAGAVLLSALLLIAGAAEAVIVVAFVGILVYSVAQPKAGIYVSLAAAVCVSTVLPLDNTAQVFVSLAQYGIDLSPVELLLLCSAIGLVIRLLFEDATAPRGGALLLPLGALIFTVVLGIGYGMAHGPDMSVLRAETRGIFYLPVLYLLSTHLLRTRSDLIRLFWTLIVAVNVLAAFDIYQYLVGVRGSADYAAFDFAFPHEDALFCAAGIMFMLARIVWSRNVWGAWKSVALIVLPMASLLMMRRRAGMVALDASLVLLCLVLLRDNLRLFLMVVPIAVLGVGVLLAVTWNEPGGLGQPARSFRTITGSQDQSGRDKASDDYRLREELNVNLNVHNSPITGLGFGQPYAFYVGLPDLSFWPLWHYVPHNTIFWIWMKGGVLAFIALLALLASGMHRSMQLMRAMRSDSLKPGAFALGAALLMITMYSYVDLGMVAVRVLILFGIVLGSIGALGLVAEPPTLSGPAPAGDTARR